MLDIKALLENSGCPSEPIIHTESERKFLISKPDTYKLANTPGVRHERIIQTYLKTDSEIQEIRLRQSIDCFDRRTWVITEKVDIPNQGESSQLSRIEREWNIPHQIYQRLLSLYGDKTILKQRARIDYFGVCLEIDEYPFWITQAMLEVEGMTFKNGKIPLLPWIHIIKEVTHNTHYKNSYLARRYGSSEKFYSSNI